MTQTAAEHRAGLPAQALAQGQASALCEEIDADPGAGLLIDVIGPGGCGKTPLMAAAAQHYAMAGVPVVTDGLEPADGAAVLVDDAHLLD
jgi:ABC-type cobalamin transport system ATPase subunit